MNLRVFWTSKLRIPNRESLLNINIDKIPTRCSLTSLRLSREEEAIIFNYF